MKRLLIFLADLFVGNMIGWWRGYRKAIAESKAPQPEPIGYLHQDGRIFDPADIAYVGRNGDTFDLAEISVIRPAP